jgi:hypothetical protein
VDSLGCAKEGAFAYTVPNPSFQRTGFASR